MEGFQHCAHCRSLITDRGEAVGHHLSDCTEIETTPEVISMCERRAHAQEECGYIATAAEYRIIAARLRRLYAIVLEVSTEEPR